MFHTHSRGTSLEATMIAELERRHTCAFIHSAWAWLRKVNAKKRHCRLDRGECTRRSSETVSLDVLRISRWPAMTIDMRPRARNRRWEEKTDVSTIDFCAWWYCYPQIRREGVRSYFEFKPSRSESIPVKYTQVLTIDNDTSGKRTAIEATVISVVAKAIGTDLLLPMSLITTLENMFPFPGRVFSVTENTWWMKLNIQRFSLVVLHHQLDCCEAQMPIYQYRTDIESWNRTRLVFLFDSTFGFLLNASMSEEYWLVAVPRKDNTRQVYDEVCRATGRDQLSINHIFHIPDLKVQWTPLT